MSKWPMVALGDVIRHRKEFIQINDFEEYKRCRVQLHTRGVVLRDMISGAAIKTKKQQVCRSGEFLVAEIDAKHGGYGIVPDDLDRAIVSSHYFLFEIDSDKLNRDFLEYYIRTPAFFDQVTAQGSTNYAAIRPSHVLEYKMPLPSLSEQRRLVEWIDDVARRVEEARRLIDETNRHMTDISRSIIWSDASDEAIPTPMGELVRLREPDITVVPEESYDFAGVYCFGRGVFRGQTKRGIDFKYPKLTRLRVSNFVYPKLMAWEGALAVVPQECDGLVVSTEFPVFEIDESKVLSEVLDVYFRTPNVWPEISGSSTGTNVRRRRLNPKDFLKYRFPLPPMSVQDQICKVQARSEQAKQCRQRAVEELNALVLSVLNQTFHGEPRHV